MNTGSELLAQAARAAENAHSPYSQFKVGCALLAASGRIFTGCNVENASYGLAICAERNAIFHAVSEDGPGMRIQALAVIALGQEFPPCGACRQVIAEFALPAPDASTAVWFMQGGKPVRMSIAELLPSGFRL